MSHKTSNNKNGSNELDQLKQHNLSKQIGGNILWLVLGRFGSQILMVLFTILIARRLGEVGFGQYAFLASIIVVANVVTSFGTDMLLVREIAADGNLSPIPASLLIQISLSILLVVTVFFTAPLIPNQTAQAIHALRLYSLTLFPLTFYTSFSAALRGSQRMDAFTFLISVTGILQLILAWFLLTSSSNIVTLALLLLGVQVFAAIFAATLCLRYVPGFRQILWVPTPAKLITLIKISAPIALLGLFGMFYQRLGLFMLTALDGAAATGWYSAALRIVEAPKVIHIAVLGALFPVMSQTYAPHPGRSSPIQSEKLFSLSWKSLLTIAVLISLALYTFADPIINFLYGNAYHTSVAVLKILTWILIPYTITHYLSLRLLSSQKEKSIAYALIASLTALILLGGLVIPAHGIIGAATAVVIAESIQAVLLILFWRQQRPALSHN